MFQQLVEIDLERCIGCQNCSEDCPWEVITMFQHDDSFTAWGNTTVKSTLYIDESALPDLGIKVGEENEEEQTTEES